jgi:hypothetical protein
VNLGQLCEFVQNDLQHAPTAQAWKNDLIGVINNKYTALMNSERWAYRTVEGSMRLRADETGVTFTIAGNGTSRYVQLRGAGGGAPGVVHHHDFDAILMRASEGENSLRRWGRIAGGKDWNPRWSQVRRQYDSRLGGWPDPDLDSSTSAFNIAGTDAVFLDATPSYPSVDPLGLTDYTGGILRHDRYQLPYDCGEIIGIVSRDDKRGEIPLVNRTRERSLMLNTNQDSAGAPEAWLLDDPVDSGGPGPRKTMVATASNTAGGTLTTATTYRYFYCYYGNGTMSGPSNITSTLVTAPNDTITLTNLEAGPVDSGSVRLQEWRKKLIFRDDGDGVFRYLAQVQSETTSYEDDGTPAPDETFRWDDRMAAPRKAIRFWPRPSQDQWVSVSYLRTPNRLVTLQDVPEFPEEYHAILHHQAVVQLAARFGQSALIPYHRQEANDLINLMRTKELQRYSTDRLGSWSPDGDGVALRTKPATMG